MTHDSYRPINLIVPQQLELFDLASKGEVYVNLEDSINLQSFSLACGSKATITVQDELPLKTVNLACSANLRILGNLGNFFTNVEKLSIDLFGCYSVFGTFEDSTTIPRSNEVPEFTTGTYRLNFLILQNIKRVLIEGNALDNIICAFPLIDERILTVQILEQMERNYMEFKHNLSQGPIIVEYLSGKDSTEKKYTYSQWRENNRICYN